MTTIVRVEGIDLLVEARDLDPGREVLVNEEVQQLPEKLEKSLQGLPAFIEKARRAIDACEPDKVSVEFGIELAIEGGHLTALVTKSSMSGSMKVTAEWTKHR